MFYGCERLSVRLFEFSLYLCRVIKERAKWDLFCRSKYRRETVLNVTLCLVSHWVPASPPNYLTDFHLVFTQYKCSNLITKINEVILFGLDGIHSYTSLDLDHYSSLLSFCQCLPCLSAFIDRVSRQESRVLAHYQMIRRRPTSPHLELQLIVFIAPCFVLHRVPAWQSNVFCPRCALIWSLQLT